MPGRFFTEDDIDRANEHKDAEETGKFPPPSKDMTKAAAGTQLHHAKLCQNLEDIVEICDLKIEAEMEKPVPDAAEIEKLKRIKYTAQTEQAQRRYGKL